MLFGRPQMQSTVAHRILRLKQQPAAIYAIGDIHGCLDLYNELEQQIVADGASINGPKLIVCLGDAVDRGPNTAGMLDRLIGPPPENFDRVVLRGNHEDMMVKFIETPERHLNWIDFGGEETLASYGVRPTTEKGFRAETRILKRKLDVGIPDAHRVFLNGLPIALEIGNLRFAHAGYGLGADAAQQSPELLLWGPPEQCDGYSGDEVLVHGHVIVDDVLMTDNRVNVDIGAYQSGRLAAVRFIPGSNDRKLLVSTKPGVKTPVVNLKDD
ncbi:hypothetical protein BVC71_15175 [Marivivens niveibacter]|uniref:Calcineurin-like phosphoesterase domain-containing protein n=1 Tax=Marivivens niveibacter TaxID=1930667 RepID=A0A251WUX3_9RHOB|nr:metallophosphoesterase [Marivivens niveibacter]OUD08146.1 hypothetical protein BVC71_15175 [Marivivens niveibacter]